MNIFLTDADPIVAAHNMVDKHCVKMITEAGQCLSSALRLNGYDGDDIYKISYRNHPSIKSLVDNRALFEWLCMHALELCEMYTRKSGKTHATEAVIFRCIDLIETIPDAGKTIYDIQTACSDLNDSTRNPVEVYRDFYVADKLCLAEWGKYGNSKPDWFQSNRVSYKLADKFRQGRNKSRKNKITLEDLTYNYHSYMCLMVDE